MGLISAVRASALLLSMAGIVAAAPKLRLDKSTMGPVSIAVGQNGQLQTIYAWNAGDGQLALLAKSDVTWLTPAVGASVPCPNGRPGSCIPIRITFNTAQLTKGIQTGTVTVSDPNAVDAPQTITVTVAMGGGIPDRLDLFVAPNGSAATAKMSTTRLVYPIVSTQNGGPWLSIAANSASTYDFGITYTVSAAHMQGMAEGSHQGSFEIKVSEFAGDKKTVPVNLRVTSQPILEAAPERVKARLPKDTPKRDFFVQFINRGVNAATVSGVTATAAQNGTWLTAGSPGAGGVTLTIDPKGLAEGKYQGNLAIASNSVAGATINVPVDLEIVPQSAPWALYRGAVTNATFNPDEKVAPGDIMAVFGEQFSYAETPIWAAKIPLERKLPADNGTRVLVNGQDVPLYYVSPGQINFQLPFEVIGSEAVVQVERNGQAGNKVGIAVQERAPHILTWGKWGVVFVNGVLALPSGLAGASRPAKRGEWLVLYTTGFGQTSPGTKTGESPSAPDARIPERVLVGLGTRQAGLANYTVPAAYAGVSSPWVGLYQVNVQIPPDAPVGLELPLWLEFPDRGVVSNSVIISVVE